jgi:ribonuclease HI
MVFMTLNVFTDGGAINNPGPAACAFVVYSDNKLLFKFSEKIGLATNNFAEYSALLKSLEWIKSNKGDKITNVVVSSDSLLMVNQVNGLFKVKNPDIRSFILRVRILEQEIGIPVVYKNIPREQNRLADALVKETLFKN